MKFFLISILSISFLFGGGDIRVDKKHIEYKDKAPKYEKLAIGYIKPKCNGDCGEPAELLPYNGEDLPEAETFPCPPVNEKGCMHDIG
jgi:hypothetical protein